MQLLGLQHPGLLRPRSPLCSPGPGQRVPAHGEGTAPPRHRGDPGRGVQPHARRRPARPHAVVARTGQPGLLPPQPPGSGLLRQLHRHRQQRQRQQLCGAANDHGLAALLGPGDARRRLPLRSGLGTGARGPAQLERPRPLRPLRTVLPGCPAGSGPGRHQADRRALGRGRRRLPAGRLSAGLERVERPLPRHDALFLAAAPQGPRRLRQPDFRRQRAVPPRRPLPAVQHQLHHLARRLHAERSGFLQPEAQRAQRRGQPRRPQRQPQLERRGRRPYGRPGHQPHPRSPETGPAGLAAAVAGHADADCRRRDEPHPAGQQQRLQPGQRHQLAGLEERRRGPDRFHGAPDPSAQEAPAAAPARLAAGRPHGLRHAGRALAQQPGTIDAGRAVEPGWRRGIRPDSGRPQ